MNYDNNCIFTLLSLSLLFVLQNLYKIMHLHFNFDTCPVHSPFGFVSMLALIGLHAICCCGQSGRVMDLLVRHCLLLGLPPTLRQLYKIYYIKATMWQTASQSESSIFFYLFLVIFHSLGKTIHFAVQIT